MRGTESGADCGGHGRARDYRRAAQPGGPAGSAEQVATGVEAGLAGGVDGGGGRQGQGSQVGSGLSSNGREKG